MYRILYIYFFKYVGSQNMSLKDLAILFHLLDVFQLCHMVTYFFRQSSQCIHEEDLVRAADLRLVLNSLELALTHLQFVVQL